jgi:predicted nucleic acid-binding protein
LTDSLIDTNVVLDVLLARQPWLNDSAAVWQACDEGRITGHIAATTLTNIFYVVRRNAGMERAHASVRVCLDAFAIIAVDRGTLIHAATLPGNDFEDNVLVACATLSRLDLIITRDPAGFVASPVPVLTPTAAIAYLHSSGQGA